MPLGGAFLRLAAFKPRAYLRPKPPLSAWRAQHLIIDKVTKLN
jgi:hypothetical protein